MNPVLPFGPPFPLPTIVSPSGSPGSLCTKRRKGKEETHFSSVRQDGGREAEVSLVPQMKAGFSMLNSISQIVVEQKSRSFLHW